MKNFSFLAAIALCIFAAAASAETSFADRMKDVEKAVSEKRPEGKDAFFAEVEKQARALMKDFPEKPEPYEMLMAVAENASGEKAAALFKELSAENTPAEVRAQAKATAMKRDAVGKPVDLKFTALDGREIDLAKMKGKVVLIDFWATWCGPCVAEVPNVVATYKKLHEKGFEIVGISLDSEKSALVDFVREKQMPWAQFFDGQGWKNEIGQRFGINSIPAMWLLDKEGKLVDMNARAGLEKKVETLLAQETAPAPTP